MTHKKVKILFVVSNLIIGGIEKVCYEIVKNIDREKFEIDFLVAVDSKTHQYYDEILKEYGCRIYKGGYITDQKSKHVFLDYERNLIKLNKYDVVHSHVAFLNAWVLRVAKQLNVKKLISHQHNTFPDISDWSIPKKIKHFIQKIFLNIYSTDRIGCTEQACIDYYGRHCKYQVFYNGFNVDDFLFLPDQKNNKKFIHIGRMDFQKNSLFLCEIIKELVSIDNTYKLYYIGDGNLRPNIQKFIEDNYLKNNIILIGATTNIQPYLSMCSYGLYPSLYEGLGISLVESQMAHNFTFYSDVVPCEADVGYAISYPLSEDAKHWAFKINEFIELEKRKNYKLDLEMVKKYDIRNIVSKIEDLYSN